MKLMKSRTLVHIPIVHSEEDMGSSSGALRQSYIRQKGLETWKQSRLVIKQFWADTDAAVSALDVNFYQTRIYQDGLPVCGFETKIVQDLAGSSAGGMNYKILARLIDMGARLEGTEDLKLLLKERDMLIESRFNSEDSGNLASEAVKEKLLEMRDYFIASRIEATLQSGETGFLFLGALHNVTSKISTTIKIMSLEEFCKSN
jgi:hypothetical protein